MKAFKAFVILMMLVYTGLLFYVERLGASRNESQVYVDDLAIVNLGEKGAKFEREVSFRYRLRNMYLGLAFNADTVMPKGFVGRLTISEQEPKKAIYNELVGYASAAQDMDGAVITEFAPGYRVDKMNAVWMPLPKLELGKRYGILFEVVTPAEGDFCVMAVKGSEGW